MEEKNGTFEVGIWVPRTLALGGLPEADGSFPPRGFAPIGLIGQPLHVAYMWSPRHASDRRSSSCPRAPFFPLSITAKDGRTGRPCAGLEAHWPKGPLAGGRAGGRGFSAYTGFAPY